MTPWGSEITFLSNARVNEVGRVGSWVSERWTPSWMLGLWCGALGYYIEISKLLPELIVCLCGLHLYLALLLLLLQLLVFPINRKERGNSVRALAAAARQQNCAALEKKVGTLWYFIYSISDTPIFQEAWKSNKPNKLALKALHLDKRQDFSLQSRSHNIMCLPTVQKVKALFGMLSG